jgi:CRAL/TRIO domain
MAKINNRSFFHHQTVFPVPTLRTMDGYEVCYMRPSRHSARSVSSTEVLESVAYTISTMMEREESCNRGIPFLANMEDFTMSNFSIKYWRKLMLILQGDTVPVRVHLFLIVNPPAWFGTIWKLTKPILSSDFQERVKMIQESNFISEYLAPGHDVFLPTEMTHGQASTEEMVREFVDRRKVAEAVPRRHTLSALGMTCQSRVDFDLAKQQSRRKLGMSRQNSITTLTCEKLDTSLRRKLR